MHTTGKRPLPGSTPGLAYPTIADIKRTSATTDAPPLLPPQATTQPPGETPEDLLRASRLYFELLRNQPHDVEALHSAARTSLKLGEASNAMIFCNRALSLDLADSRKSGQLLVIRGVARRLLGQHVASLNDLRAAASLNPGNREAAQQLALTLGELERPVGEADASLENREDPLQAGRM